MARNGHWAAVAAVFAAACGSTSGAAKSPATGEPAPAGSVEIAIYPSTAIVREQRMVSLESGTSEVRFDDMPTGLDVGSVRFVSLTDPTGTRAVEQVVRAQPQRERTLPEWIELTGDPERPLRLRPRRRVERHATTVGGVTWSVQSVRGGEQEVAVSYQTHGLVWRADYAVVLSDDGEDTADLNAWITIDNRSGRSYEGAQVTLIVKEKDDPKPTVVAPTPSNIYDGRGMAASFGGQPQTAQQSPPAPKYRPYVYRRRVNLRDRAQRQLEWFGSPLRRLASKKIVVFDPVGSKLDHDEVEPATAKSYGVVADARVTIGVELPPVPREMPPGRVRVFERTDSGALSLLGKAELDGVASGDPVRIQLGEVPGLTGRRRQTDFRLSERTQRVIEEIEIELENDGDKAREVIVREHLYRGERYEIVFASEAYAPDGERSVRFTVEVPAKGKKKLGYRVVYTWDPPKKHKKAKKP